jgi:hypothetical protein
MICLFFGGNSCIMPGDCIQKVHFAFLGDVYLETDLVMKGEVVSAGSCWAGVPAVHQHCSPEE